MSRPHSSRQTVFNQQLQEARSRHGAGDFEQAGRIYRRLLKDQPNNQELLKLLGAFFLQTVQYAKACEVLEKVIRLGVREADVYYNLALAFYHQDMVDAAIEAHEHAIVLHPCHEAAHYMLARACLKKHPPLKERAFHAFVRDAEICSRTDSWQFAAEIAADLLAWDDCQHCARKTLALDQENYAALYSLGRALLALNHRENRVDLAQLESVIRIANLMLRLQPENVNGNMLLADALVCLQMDDLALEHFRKVVEKVPDYDLVNSNIGVLLLRNGYLEEGWQRIAARSYAADKLGMHQDHFSRCPAPVWQGQMESGLHLFVFGEQGIGDQILNGQLLVELAQRGVRLSVSVAPKIIGLMQRSLPDIAFFDFTKPIPQTLMDSADFKCDLMDLGRYLRRSMDSFPEPKHFLVPDPALVQHFREKYSQFDQVVKVGIAWKSASQTTGSVKSSRLDEWEALLQVPGVKFFSVQYGDVDNDIAQVRETLGVDIYVDDFNPFDDFDKATAQLAVMDLVISVSNAAVHASAQLDVPTWVLLATRPLWHWFMVRTDSPWYESVTLFRQRELEGWTPVISRVAQCLRDVLDDAS